MKSESDHSDFEDLLAAANDKIYRSPEEARTLLDTLLATVPDNCTELQARVTERLSIVERILGNFDLAARLGETAAAGYKTCQNPIGVSRAWVSLGNIHWSRGNLDQALDYYQKAYAQRAKLNDFAATAGALASMANIHVEMGRLSSARDEYEKVLGLAHRANDRRIIARTENNLSECLLMMGHTGTALNHARNALNLCRKLGDRSEEPNVLINLGRILGKLKFWAEAKGHLTEAVEMATEVGDRRAAAEAQAILAQQLRDNRKEPEKETANEIEDRAYVTAKEMGAVGLQKFICEQAISAATELKDTTRSRRYEKRLKAINSA